MDKREIYANISILVAATGIGLLIVILYNTTWTQLLFVVIEVLALLYITSQHRKSNIYYCMQCGQKVKIGLIPDLECTTLDNGDKILKCKKCKKKVNFRKYDPTAETKIEEESVSEKQDES